jgi:hypothetical protein
MVACLVCGVDPDKVTSGRCMCPVMMILCTCGKYVVPGEVHYHLQDSADTKPCLFFGLDAKVYHHNEDATNTKGV